jgi:hypothetical protein
VAALVQFRTKVPSDKSGAARNEYVHNQLVGSRPE